MQSQRGLLAQSRLNYAQRLSVLRGGTGSPWTAVRVHINRVFAAHDHFQGMRICIYVNRSVMRDEKESAKPDAVGDYDDSMTGDDR